MCKLALGNSFLLSMWAVTLTAAYSVFSHNTIFITFFPKYSSLTNSDGETQILGMLIKREF